jgi:hypothetical protein
LRRWGFAAVLALAVAACGSAVETLTPLETVDCQGVPAQQCQEAADQARGVSRARLLQVVVRCATPPCTDQAGQLDAQATYDDGTGTAWSSAWGAVVPGQPGMGGAPAALPVRPVCLGVAEAICLEMASSTVSGLPPGGPAVRSISVRCTTVCTPTKAEGAMSIVFADGTSTFSSWGYDSGG